MSKKTQALSNAYGSFFFDCAKFTASPYTKTFQSIASSGTNNTNEDILKNAVIAGIVCGILTFIVPVLPVLCTITFSLASVAMSIAVASMLLTYPLALLGDACTPSSTSSPLNNEFVSQKF